MIGFLLFCWIIVITIITVVLAILYFAITSLWNKDITIPQIAVRAWGRLCLLFHPIEIIGKENILQNQSQIIYSNHQSSFDILLYSAVMTKPFSWMAKDSLFHVPIFGNLMKKLGYIPVYRDHKMKAGRSIINAIKKLRDGVNVIIFPEGTWNDSTSILPFKDGLYHLAVKSQAPLLPINVIGTEYANPPDSRQIRLGKLKLVIHPPIYSHDYCDLDKDTFLQK